jgi:hypothetical protein
MRLPHYIDAVVEIAKHRWTRKFVKRHLRDVKDAACELGYELLNGIFALVVLVIGGIRCIPVFIWRWTFGMLLEARRVTPEMLIKLKRINTEGDT